MSTKPGLQALTDLRPRITVIGVGGAGCNAINNMISAGLTGVEFVVANTDSQSLANSSAEARLQLGTRITEGLGAGSRPEIGEAAAQEAIDDIRAQIAGSHMVFVAAGMGGGTGTGAAAVIARAAKEMGILTVGVVTKPFLFEGARRLRQAETGINELRQYVDTLIVIPNQNLFRIANEKTTFEEAFVLADQVLYSGVACIVDLIVKEGLINLDFADVRTVMSGMGTAMMGTGEASGERRAIVAAEEAISNPLLDDVTLRGAKGLLLSITGSHNLTLFEVYAAANRVKEEIDPEANIIFGATFDDTLGDRVRVSIVASGMAQGAAQGTTNASAAQPGQAYAAPAPSSASYGAAPHQPAPAQSTFMPASPAAHAGRSDAALSPPPIPQPVQATGHDAHDDLQRRLSDALQQQTGPSSPAPAATSAPIYADHAPYSPPHSAPREQWRAPGDVLIEAGLPEHTSPLHSAPPRMTELHAPALDQQAFKPRATVEIRRAGRHIPGIEDFPPVAQRDYYAKKQASPHGAPAPQNEPQRRQGLLERITGKFRYESDSPGLDRHQTQTQSPTSHGSQFVSDAAPQNAAPAHHQTYASDSAKPAEHSELPVFFGARRRS